MNKLFRILFIFCFASGLIIAQDAYEKAPKQTEPVIPIHYGEQQYEAPADVLFDNGPLVNAPGGGFGGADGSLLQSALSMTIYGFGHQVVNNNSMADDFTVTGNGWNVDQMQFFAYQTGSTTTSTINEVRVQIWDGDPTAGGTVIFGDLTTNRMVSSTFTNIYRAIDTNPTASNRPIMVQTVAIGITLAPGTYWVQWMTGGTLASGPWAPPITINGVTNTGNAKQNLAGVWGEALDGTFPQGMPFIVLGNVVPVELTSFTADVNNGIVVLNWQTATEINNQGFQIERRAEASDFTSIGFVAGSGTTTEPRSYSFTDNSVGNGKYFYRLKQIDFDGSFEYSNEIEVTIITPLTFGLEQNYPNPFNPSTNIKYSIPEAGNVKLSVYNIVGEEVALLINGYSEAGTFDLIFDASILPSGVYLYKLQSGNSVQTRKMMLLK